MSRRTATAWGLGVAAAIGTAVVASAGPSLAYLDLVRRYAAGERAAAVAELGRFTQAGLAKEVEALRAQFLAVTVCPSCPRPESVPLRAVVMLHTDRDELERRPAVATEQAPTCGNQTHALFAERVVALLLDHPSGREFARRWYLALTLRSFGPACLEDARQWALAGVKWFPADPELLLAGGTVGETIAAMASITPKREPMYPREQAMVLALVQQRRLLLEEACRSFEQALRAEPSLEEARLRLGRTRLRLEQPEAARKALQAVVESGSHASFVYLGHLFLARLEEGEGRLEHAEREALEARALDPTAQSAAVALSHVLQLRGEPEAAREALEDALASSEPGTTKDPLWEYAWGQAARAEELLADLRREASR